MLKTTGMLNNELSNYANSGAVIRRMVHDGQLTAVRHGLYETDTNTPGICLAIHIYLLSKMKSMHMDCIFMLKNGRKTSDLTSNLHF